MDAATLQVRLALGQSRTASRIGSPHDIFRPQALLFPLDPGNLIQRIPAAFLPESGHANRAVTDTQPYWTGAFDTTITRPGDLLRRVSDHATWFIAAQQLGLPPLCTRCTRLIDITRPASASTAGLNVYGGTITATDTLLAQAWPARFLGSGSTGTADYGIAGELPTGTYIVLLPVSLAVRVLNGDRITDDLGRTNVVAGAELTDQAWRLTVQQAP
jgi:hypothetical protein